MEITTKLIGADEFGEIKELWVKLNSRHLNLSKSFKEHYERQTFDKRMAKLLALPESCLRTEAAMDGENKIGYCVCSASGGSGELESIYIEPEYRGQRLGYILASRAIEWMKRMGCETISVSVADGNEAVFPFYERLGFAVRRTVLQLK